jgi:hypothetical protein
VKGQYLQLWAPCNQVQSHDSCCSSNEAGGDTIRHVWPTAEPAALVTLVVNRRYVNHLFCAVSGGCNRVKQGTKYACHGMVSPSVTAFQVLVNYATSQGFQVTLVIHVQC